jgi:hypothetical protein
MEKVLRIKTMLIMVACALSLLSCEKDVVKYPIYSLTKVDFVPDSLKVEHREWITGIVKAASQNMTAGDYENVDQTIIQAKLTADKLFEVSITGLRKQIDGEYYNDIKLLPSHLTVSERKILDSLSLVCLSKKIDITE